MPAKIKLEYESDSLASRIVNCKRCPRLLEHCQAVARKEKQILRRFSDEKYWGKPVPNFGASPTRLLIVGLAPGAHGANRTSRMFTGDDSGHWLYRALHKAGFAKTSGYERAGDNELIDCAITSAGHCAPPDNKPLPEELAKCAPFLLETMEIAKPEAILCLGSIAWKAALSTLKEMGYENTRGEFKHLARLETKTKDGKPGPVVHASFHPSRQNTNTKKLTEPMFDSVFARIRKELY